MVEGIAILAVIIGIPIGIMIYQKIKYGYSSLFDGFLEALFEIFMYIAAPFLLIWDLICLPWKILKWIFKSKD